MKSFLSSILFFLCGFSVEAQTVDEVINSHITAMGGAEKLKKIGTVTMQGILNIQGLDVEVTVNVKHGVGFRNDIIVPGMGEGFQIMTPGKGWSYMPFQGQTSVEELSAEEVKQRQQNLDAQGVLFNYKEKGYTAELTGKETIDNIECYKISLLSKDSAKLMMFIDTKTFYKIKTVSFAKGELTFTSYSNHKQNADGYIFPYSQTNGAGTIEYSLIEVNKPIDESLFKGG